MKFKLNVPERLVLLNLLPRENNFVMLKLIREASNSIGLSDAEIIEFEVKQDGDSIKFKAEKGIVEKEIEIGERAYSMICESLEKLDKDKKLLQDHVTIYEKFVNKKK